MLSIPPPPPSWHLAMGQHSSWVRGQARKHCEVCLPTNFGDNGRTLGPEHCSLLWQWPGSQEVLHRSWPKSRPQQHVCPTAKGPFMSMASAGGMRPAGKAPFWAPTNPSWHHPCPPVQWGAARWGSACPLCHWEAGSRLWTLALNGSECPHPLPTLFARRGSSLICYTLFSCCLGMERSRD